MVVVGVSWKAVSGDRDPVLLFLDNNGKVTAESTAFNNNRDQRPVGILPTEDKGILMVAFDFAQIDVIKVKNNGQF
jgi:glucose/arabinose dehydrogenase